MIGAVDVLNLMAQPPAAHGSLLPSLRNLEIHTLDDENPTKPFRRAMSDFLGHRKNIGLKLQTLHLVIYAPNAGIFMSPKWTPGLVESATLETVPLDWNPPIDDFTDPGVKRL